MIYNIVFIFNSYLFYYKILKFNNYNFNNINNRNNKNIFLLKIINQFQIKIKIFIILILDNYKKITNNNSYYLLN